MVCSMEEVWWEVREIWGFGLICCCACACSHECTREEGQGQQVGAGLRGWRFRLRAFLGTKGRLILILLRMRNSCQEGCW